VQDSKNGTHSAISQVFTQRAKFATRLEQQPAPG
jgi:hypothetical protein